MDPKGQWQLKPLNLKKMVYIISQNKNKNGNL